MHHRRAGLGRDEEGSMHPKGPDAAAQVRTEHDVHGFVTRTCFKTGPPGRVGIESEWFVQHDHDPTATVPLARLQRLLDAAGPLPGGSAISFEPGGQIELSTICAPDPGLACELLRGDLAALDKVLTDHRLARAGFGVSPVAPPCRVLDTPRYAAMEAYFDADDTAGRVMMTSTAAVQVSLDAGADDRDVRRRWHLLNDLAPLLTAAFANSPLHRGRPTGLRSTRADVWSRIDAGRTARPVGDNPVEAWTRYALDARVLLVRRENRPWVADPGMTFAEWVSGDTPHGRPTYDDLAYHLTTLFPPVRPHGWLEVRSIDALADEHWPVAVAVTTALVEDPRAADRAREALERLTTVDDAAYARDALTEPRLRHAATTCFEAALDALPRLGVDGALTGPVSDYLQDYVGRGRTPADDVLDELTDQRRRDTA
jgi:glutamate--cysteine ligase